MRKEERGEISAVVVWRPILSPHNSLCGDVTFQVQVHGHGPIRNGSTEEVRGRRQEISTEVGSPAWPSTRELCWKKRERIPPFWSYNLYHPGRVKIASCSVTHSEESAICRLLHTWVHRRLPLARVAVINRRDRGYRPSVWESIPLFFIEM